MPLLQADYPGSSQVELLHLEAATDREIWEFARTNDFIIVTRDSDFHELSMSYRLAKNWQSIKSGYIA